MRSIANSETVQIAALVTVTLIRLRDMLKSTTILKNPSTPTRTTTGSREQGSRAVLHRPPNSMHREYTERAASAGKHVL